MRLETVFACLKNKSRKFLELIEKRVYICESKVWVQEREREREKYIVRVYLHRFRFGVHYKEVDYKIVVSNDTIVIYIIV